MCFRPVGVTLVAMAAIRLEEFIDGIISVGVATGSQFLRR
jgi:hypothetical protein